MKVFISHKLDEDAKFISLLRDALAVEDVELLEAAEMVSPGEHITTVIENIIKSATAVVALFPETSSAVSFELGIAVGAGRRALIVTKHQDELPFDLRAFPSIQIESLDNQSASDLAARIKSVMAEELVLENLSPNELEELVANYFRENGFNVNYAEQNKDVGFDLIVEDPKNGRRIIVETKSLSPGNRVSVGVASRLSAAAAAIGAVSAILVSTSGFTSAARSFGTARGAELALITLAELRKLKSENKPLIGSAGFATLKK